MADKRITDVDIVTSLDSDESFFINKNNSLKQINREDIVFGIANGGTGASDVATARSNLGALSKYGDTMTGNFTMTGHLTLKRSDPYLILSNTDSGDELVIHYYGLESGKNTIAFYDRKKNVHLFTISQDSGKVSLHSPLDVAYGGTGTTTLQSLRNNLGLGNTSGALPIANGGTGATTVADARNNLGAQSQHITSTATLFASGWSNLTQTVSVSGVNASNTVIARPAPASYIAYCEAGVYCYAQSSGSLTFKCVDTPTSDLTVNILILN